MQIIMSRPPYCYLNRAILPVSRARLHFNDIVLLRGYGAFEFLRTYHGVPFLLKEHFARLTRTAHALGLTVPVTERQFKTAIRTLIAKNNMKEANVRVILTGGTTPDGMSLAATPTFSILTEPLTPLSPALYKKGIKLITHEHQREFPEVKTTNYLTAMTLQTLKKAEGAFEILYVSRGKVLEATTSNFFLFKGNTLVTPKRNVLIGTTRNFVLALAKPFYTIEERDIQTRELRSASEAFITATNKEILPVVRIDNQKIGSGRVGTNTMWLLKLFRDRTQNFGLD